MPSPDDLSSLAIPSAATVTSRPRHHRYSPGEEIANSLTHGFGTVLAVIGLVTAVLAALRVGDAPRYVVSTAVYGGTLVFLYLNSTLYHGIRNPRAKDILQILDHVAIYLLIAGTYTPFTLITLRGPWGWSVFGAIWGLAVVGVGFEAFWVRRPKWLSALVYIAMGWIIAIATRPLLAALARPGVYLLFIGGFLYTFGTVFYVWKRVRYMHAVWHLWVLAGSACHFAAVLLYVLPGK